VIATESGDEERVQANGARPSADDGSTGGASVGTPSPADVEREPMRTERQDDRSDPQP
jgi:hypothetical protein